MRVKSGFKRSEFSQGLFKISRNGVEFLLEALFSGFKSIKVNSDGTDHFFHEFSDSVNSGFLNEDVFFRGNHLGEGDNNWGISVHEVDSGTGLDEFHGMGLEEHEAGVTNNKCVKIIKSISEDSDSMIVSLLFRNKNGMLGISDVGELGEGRLGVDLVFLVYTEINFSSVQRVAAGSVVSFRFLEGVLGIGDFTLSESEFLFAVGLLDGPHGVVLSLFSSDLFVELLNGIENGSEWSTAGDLGLDFSEKTGVGEFAHGLQSLFFDGRGACGNKDDGEDGEGFHCWMKIIFFVLIILQFL